MEKKLWFRAENTGVIIESINPPEKKGYMVCHVSPDTNGNNLDARVNLIIAAPDMYEALKEMRKILDTFLMDCTIPANDPRFIHATMVSNDALWALNRAEGNYPQR